MNDQSQIHRSTLVKILKDIYSDATLAKSLGFKGGTAAYLCYGLPRASVDLDFDLLLPQNTDYVWNHVRVILEKHGVVQDSYMKRVTMFFLLQYRKGAWHIKHDISLRPTVAKFSPITFLGIPLLIMNKNSMAASKLSALLTRKKLAARDLFDLWFFLHEDWPIDEAIVKEKTGKDIQDAYNEAIKKVESTPDNHLLQGMGELLNNKQKDWVKSKLKPELIFLLKLRHNTP